MAAAAHTAYPSKSTGIFWCLALPKSPPTHTCNIAPAKTPQHFQWIMQNIFVKMGGITNRLYASLRHVAIATCPILRRAAVKPSRNSCRRRSRANPRIAEHNEVCSFGYNFHTKGDCLRAFSLRKGWFESAYPLQVFQFPFRKFYRPRPARLLCLARLFCPKKASQPALLASSTGSSPLTNSATICVPTNTHTIGFKTCGVVLYLATQPTKPQFHPIYRGAATHQMPIPTVV